MRVAIVGPGCVGLALASTLAGRADALHLVGRPGPASEALAREGFARTGIFGEATVAADACSVHTRVAALAGQTLDFVLVCTKSTALAPVANELAAVWPELAGEPRIVLCQNGWGNTAHFVRHLPAERIFSARVITGFRRESTTRVKVTVHADSIALGSLFGAETGVLEPLCAAIRDGGLPCETSEAIEQDLWAKVLYNCLLNPLGALLGVPYGELGRRRETRAIMEAVAREIFAVLEKSGHRTHWPHATAYLETFYGQLLPPTATHESSMLQDIRAGRATEIDALCGAVSALAAESGTSAPVNDALLQLVRACEGRPLHVEG